MKNKLLKKYFSGQISGSILEEGSSLLTQNGLLLQHACGLHPPGDVPGQEDRLRAQGPHRGSRLHHQAQAGVRPKVHHQNRGKRRRRGRKGLFRGDRRRPTKTR